jgi:hypothetical protein
MKEKDVYLMRTNVRQIYIFEKYIGKINKKR